MHSIIPVLAALIISFPQGNPFQLDYFTAVHHVTVINTRSGHEQSVSQKALEHSPVFVPCYDCEETKHKEKVSPTPSISSWPTATSIPTPEPTFVPDVTVMPEPTIVNDPPCKWKWDDPELEHPMRPEVIVPCPILEVNAI